MFVSLDIEIEREIRYIVARGCIDKGGEREVHESSGYAAIIPEWVIAESVKTSPQKFQMGSPPAEELLRKIQELEAGQAHLKEEMSKLMLSGDTKSEHHHHYHHQRSHSVSPQRSPLPAAGQPRRKGGLDGGASAWKKGSVSFRHSSPLQRESRSREPVNAEGPSAANFTNKQYLNILQSMGQSVHIFDLNGRIIYWSVVQLDVIDFRFTSFKSSFMWASSKILIFWLMNDTITCE